MGSQGFEKKPVHALEGSLCHLPAECLDTARKMALKLSLNPFSPDYARGMRFLRRLWRKAADSRSNSLFRQVASRINRMPQPP
jgi:hypothetical protein